MASIRKRNGKWQVQIRLAGLGPRSATHATKSKAIAWGVEEERKLLAGETQTPKDIRSLKGMTLGELATAFKEAGKVCPSNHTGYRVLMADPIADIPLTRITKRVVDEWSTRLKAKGLKASSIARYCHVPRAAWDYGLDVLELPINGKNLFGKLRLKGSKGRRERRLYPNEYETLIHHLTVQPRHGRTVINGDSMKDIIDWAIETSMRRGELAKARLSQITPDGKFLFIPETKTDKKRTIPLTKKAQEIAVRRKLLGYQTLLFPYRPGTITRSFTKLTRSAKLADLHFHDLRHEGLSRLNERGLSVFDMKLVSGHTRTDSLDIYIQSELKRVAELMGA